MKALVIDVIAILEMVGVIALIGIGGGVEQNLMPFADGIKYVLIIGGLMALGAGILWLTRDKEKFE
jgi:hypothetical protein